MTDIEIVTLIKSEVNGIHGKLDTMIMNQSEQKTEIELIKHDIVGNGSPGIKQILESHGKRIECLESAPKKKMVQRIPWVISCISIAVALGLGIAKLLGG